MEGNHPIYMLQTIARLICSRTQREQKLHARRAWMVIGVSGNGTVAAGHERYPVANGGAVMGDGNLALQAEGGAEAWELLFVEFAPFHVLDLDKAAAEASPRLENQQAPYAGELAELAERLYSVVHLWPESPQRSLTAHILLQQMMLWWMDNEKEERSRSGRPTELAVLATLRYMETHFAETLTREQLADKAGVAHTYFSVLCKKLTGTSPSVYLEQLRAHRAAELLLQDRDGKGDLIEIARRAGFRDPWYMSRRFRKILGMSPSAYRSGFVPERPVSLQYPYTHHLLALGIRPAAARFSGTSDVIDASVRQTVTELPQFLSLDSQKEWLSAIRPQVILTYDGERIQERLRGVAPVVHIPWLSMNWREQLMAIGRLFRKHTEAAAVIAELERQAVQARSEVHGRIPAGTRISIFKILQERCFLYGIRDAGCIFYEFLDFAPHPYVQQCIAQDPNFHSVEIPISRMADYAESLNAVILYPGDSEQNEFLSNNGHWRQFAASRTIVCLDYREWLHYDPIHMKEQLNIIGPILQKHAACR